MTVGHTCTLNADVCSLNAHTHVMCGYTCAGMRMMHDTMLTRCVKDVLHRKFWRPETPI